MIIKLFLKVFLRYTTSLLKASTEEANPFTCLGMPVPTPPVFVAELLNILLKCNWQPFLACVLICTWLLSENLLASSHSDPTVKPIWSHRSFFPTKHNPWKPRWKWNPIMFAFSSHRENWYDSSLRGDSKPLVCLNWYSEWHVFQPP